MKLPFPALLCPAAPVAGLLLLAGCGTPAMDLGGYPNAAQERLYRDGRLGNDKGLAEFDLRKAWRAVIDARGTGT
jgi:hypothetical protein